MNNQEYELNEARLLERQLQDVRNAPLRNRREAGEAMFQTMQAEPALVAERVGWVINGSYGWGACRKAKNILTWKGNKPAALVQLVAALEWSCPEDKTRQAWNKLSKTQQDELDRLVNGEIKSVECAIA